MKSMKMKLGNGYMDVSVPDENLLGIIRKEAPSASRTEDEVILEALANPIATSNTTSGGKGGLPERSGAVDRI